jgi:phytanoyl-CoA hydroxylase
MSYTQYRGAFERDGFVVVPRFLTGNEFDELKRNLERYISEVVPSLPATDAFYQDPNRPETLKQIHGMERDSYFEAMMSKRKWIELAEALLGEPCEYHGGPEWFNKPPCTEHPTPPHQDNYYLKYDPPLVLAVWLALEPIDAENGCLRYVPGSHTRGIRPHARSNVLGFSQAIVDWSSEDEATEVQVELEAGDAVVHHAQTIHRADANRSTVRHRRAYAHVLRAVRANADDAALSEHAAALREHLATFDLPQ